MQSYNTFEKEALLLYAASLLTDELANRALVIPPLRPDGPARFANFCAGRLFFIWLVDFLSPSDEKVFGEKNPYLRGLCEINQSNHFNNQTGADNLSSACDDFRTWLEAEITIEGWYWSASLDLEHDLKIKRFDLITLYANIQKHNFSRLGGAAERLRKILDKNGHPVRHKDALLALGDLESQMDEGFGIVDYYASTLIEFVVNIRWAIQDYLEPFYLNCKKSGSDGGYVYNVPSAISDDFAETCFWNLMNTVLKKPIIQKFQTPSELKGAF